MSDSPDRFARAVALYAALLSTATLLWNVRRDSRDRGVLRVGVQVATDSTFGRLVIADQIAWSIVNTGRRPIYLQDLGGIYRDGTPFGLTLSIPPNGGFKPLPRQLEPGQRELIWTVLPEVPRNVLRLAAWDTERRIYFPQSTDLRSVLRLALHRAGEPPKLGFRHAFRTLGPISRP
jgi:hypothetical protein